MAKRRRLGDPHRGLDTSPTGIIVTVIGLGIGVALWHWIKKQGVTQ